MMFAANSKDTDSSSPILPDQTCQRFTLAQIQSATHNFDDQLVIGQGGFGKVYKCPLTIGSVVTEVAIKRLDSASNQGATEFEAEVKLLSKLRHGNLVSLIGYCNEEKDMVLVYEFMPNGTLKDRIHKADCVLSWLQRLQICIGAARGLEYLHTGTATQQGVTHRDVKTSNILLDANFAAKVSDFGLAKVGPINQSQSEVSTAVKGTFGYMDPCYFFSGKLTRKSDVYAFGVVLFEVLSGKKAVDSTLDEDQWSLAAWVQDKIKKGKVNKIMDSRLIGQISRKGLKEFAGIARQCLHTQPKQRPTMAEVVARLESILSHEREFTYSAIDERRFINKVRFFVTGKPDLTNVTSKADLAAVTSKADLTTFTSEVTSKADLLPPSLKIFTFDELKVATNNFKDKGQSPTSHKLIYKGWVDERTYSPTEYGVGLAMYVNIKDVFTSKLDLKLEELTQLSHPNLVKLLGYCLKERELFRVYELIPDATLDELLYREQGGTSLSWVARLKIALGAARGLSFLHQRNHPAYNQFTTACILVDVNFNARLLDFEVENSFVSCSYSFKNDTWFSAPEWFHYRAHIFDCSIMHYGSIELKSEIYSFGVVLLEMLTGMMVFDDHRPKGKQNLVKWATPLLADEGNLGTIMDPRLLHNNCPPKGAFKLALLISNCLQATPTKRPCMEEIVPVLYECHHESKEVESI